MPPLRRWRKAIKIYTSGRKASLFFLSFGHADTTPVDLLFQSLNQVSEK
ncbi:hypothetical protein DM82_5701 [Burkholderia oklahomensis]|uniref:Uncharacterized protein n=1 Tax=Burkholderia oklahomensis TaxID=342113 RepID=A0AAI8FRU2_9BURK|nr:hypothetical protein DM82_5701 [Burkholderia oklahomensis]AJX33808.1 hypothetical protein BG90_4932 [Burkholderia oklahomensis C6786]SUY27293.1 Uncharacterised protein [Burkholderia oklahomensis]